MSAATQPENTITIRKVSNPSERSSIIAQYFGRYMMVVENKIYDALEKHSKDYKGGFWVFYEVTLGEERVFYMAPEKEQAYEIVSENQSTGTASADAAGLIACLSAYCYFACVLHEKDDEYSDRFNEMYHLLRTWALQHEEWGVIYRALD